MSELNILDQVYRLVRTSEQQYIIQICPKDSIASDPWVVFKIYKTKDEALTQLTQLKAEDWYKNLRGEINKIYDI